MCADGYDVANPFVPADERDFGRERPVTLAGMQVRVAHASAMQLDETLSRSELLGLLDRIVMPDLYGRVVRHDDGGLLGLWDLWGHYYKREKGLLVMRVIVYPRSIYTVQQRTGMRSSLLGAARA